VTIIFKYYIQSATSFDKTKDAAERVGATTTLICRKLRLGAAVCARDEGTEGSCHTSTSLALTSAQFACFNHRLEIACCH